MITSGIKGVQAYKAKHPTYNTTVDEDIMWALRNFYVAYDSDTDLFTTTAIGEFRLMECKGNC